MPKAAFFTLGCKINQYETAAMKQQFFEAGFEIVEPDCLADVYVVNSCTVTAVGDRKSRQALRRMRRQNPSAVICLCGCFPQAFPEDAAIIPEADVITGSKDRSGLLLAVREKLAGGPKVVDIKPHDTLEAFESMNARDFYSLTRAYVKIEDGCARSCAYCIIPAARGPVRSKPLQEIRAEIESLAELGYAEIVLTGVNLSCYGSNFGLRLIDAVRAACASEKIRRVRLSSLEPELLTREDINEMASFQKLCPHFHLSLQSGCDETLRRMRRQYTCNEYGGILKDIRSAFKNPAITTDVMVGFPGETDDEFSSSLAFCKEQGFARAHVFAYSKRPGTSAAAMDSQIPDAIKRKRSRIMIAEMAISRAAFLGRQLKIPAEVLFETHRPDGMWEGYSENYTPVAMYADDDLRGKIMSVIPSSSDGEICFVNKL
ncbi:MAG: tRNA (N(6)-L-threonylcarbamoyladenosine(37)-C(2))-methylthiotransferase MtaB [Oscillospiraceae bacterium]|nr:tRNA (N(6)-L-threonylcarbamoyladenosine(37)-C(2))-methylthiotransferase MtaB [Oscillospiraceae bacterium]